MKRLFGGATLLFAGFSAHAGLIRADFSAGYQMGGSDVLSNGSRWDHGDAWPGLDAATSTAALQQDPFDFQDFQDCQDCQLAPVASAGADATGITFLPEPPAAEATPIPEPATLALFGLGAGALGLARQGTGKRA